jgi:hypothetical protein
MRLRVPLPGGAAVKIKTYRALRGSERDGDVPMLRIGYLYIVWESSGERRRRRF